MNRDEAYRHLTEYTALVSQAHQQPRLSKARRATVKEANQRLPVVNYILASLAPDLTPISAYSVADHLGAAPRIQRAFRILDGWQHMTTHNWSGGGPALPLNMLDPVVREPALPLWQAGKYRQAVNDAATNLNSYAQYRIGRHDISDKDLMAQALSDKEPERGKARLRCPGNPNSETVRSMQEGARAYAIGTFQAIRNPAHHLTGDWNPVTGFHHLTALSQVATWFRNWTIQRYITPPPDLSKLNLEASTTPLRD